MGHSVSIAAASVSHVRNIQPEIRGRITEEVINCIRYIWIKTPAYDGNGVSRAINIFAFVLQLVINQSWICKTEKPDVVIASSTYPLDIFAAWIIARKCKAKLVYEVHDLWPLSPIELGGMSRYHPFIMLMQYAENFAYRTSDIVISMLPKTMEHMLQHGMKREKFLYIPNGVDIEEWEGDLACIPDEHRNVISELKSKGHFLIGYAGAHGLANALDFFVDAAYRLQDYPVIFLLIGQGPEKENLIQKVRLRKQTNVVFLSSVEKKVIPAILKEIDALYIGLKGDPLFRFGVSPNKLMDYMMAGKPVIYAIQSGNDMVKDNGCGISIPPESPNEIAHAALKLMSLSEQERIEMGKKGKDYVLVHHDYRVLARQFITCLE
jgi:glycosyltransferase involved in cell wall biosynthesis